ncbi:hypothetical protein [Pseudomonas sp. WS 5071]|uniref:hypothetical protein n=1 Tax=Pseudomonas sp. WS 5071 TaxID=2717479 RepID=UPI0014764877|nr:hypothetical protein [Pseudomonas sp. WS 5071]NMY76656.1 hypothetical protein [Pseudomonas sp. WS 5071]
MVFKFARLATVGLTFLYACYTSASEPIPATAAAQPPDPDVVQRGQYVAQLGDMAASLPMRGIKLNTASPRASSSGRVPG